jgi:hypothetical protein
MEVYAEAPEPLRYRTCTGWQELDLNGRYHVAQIQRGVGAKMPYALWETSCLRLARRADRNSANVSPSVATRRLALPSIAAVCPGTSFAMATNGRPKPIE